MGNEVNSLLSSDEFQHAYLAAVKRVLKLRYASVITLQRSQKLPYTMAALIMDKMEQEGYIGPYTADGRKALKDYATEFPEDYANDQIAEKEKNFTEFVEAMGDLAERFGIILEPHPKGLLPPNVRDLEGNLLAQRFQYDHKEGKYNYIRYN